MMPMMFALALSAVAWIDAIPIVDAEGQPLAANSRRLVQALDALGAPLPAGDADRIEKAAAERDASALQKILDARTLCAVMINPEGRVKAIRGPAAATLRQGGHTPILIKVINEAAAASALRIASPQAGPIYGGVAKLSMERQQQMKLLTKTPAQPRSEVFLDMEMFASPPMTDRLSGLKCEYAIALIYSMESGQREATLGFDIGQGTQDLGFRGEVPVLFAIEPAAQVKLTIRDHDGQPTAARLTFRDLQGRVYPPQAKRLAPDLFFQPQIYRRNGETVLLPTGILEVRSTRGPEYREIDQQIEVKPGVENHVRISLQRWIHPQERGYYSGDHHIHAAGCAHYSEPTQGVTPEDMFRQVQGEGLNVGCVLTWGPCYDFQRRFFEPKPSGLSDAFSVLKYDLEISGFGSQALGHVCLLNLKDQTYPGSDGTAVKGWPSWTTPVLRWAKEQGGVTGYAHSASGLEVNPQAASRRLLSGLDQNQDGRLSAAESANGLLPESFERIDANRDRFLGLDELEVSHDRAADRLPNHAIPEMNGVGAMELCVSVTEGVCDFISSMDTSRIQEWSTWYHVLNCGFPLKTSGETDFPCMSGFRAGQGRTYARLGKVERLNFADWCQALARGQSYVSDGYAHAFDFAADGVMPGAGDLRLDRPKSVRVRAQVAFAPAAPKTVAQGLAMPPGGPRRLGDTVVLHGPRTEEWADGGERMAELIVNGEVVASRSVPADGKIHDLTFDVPIARSSWVALRQFPQLHTNPVTVVVAGQPIRASKRSALWCAETIRTLWRNRRGFITEAERGEAEKTFERAIERYRKIAAESDHD